MADSPDFRQMMDALDEAFKEQMKVIFGGFCANRKDAGAAEKFSSALKGYCEVYAAAAAAIEKEAGMSSKSTT